MIKVLIEGLEFCKENKLYDKHINIALGINKVPMSIREGLKQQKLRHETRNN
tara:strand:+ start:257 stop:412 length:156 start_codon:yes stop_codon:yes gene_type:complete